MIWILRYYLKYLILIGLIAFFSFIFEIIYASKTRDISITIVIILFLFSVMHITKESKE